VPPDVQVAMTRARGIWLCSFVFLAAKGGDKSILTLRHLTGASPPHHRLSSPIAASMPGSPRATQIPAAASSQGRAVSSIWPNDR
jgi:hypothetical protein